MKKLLCVMSLVLSANAYAFETTVKIDGSACAKHIRGEHVVSTGEGDNGYLLLPIRIYVEKYNSKDVAKSCLFELPLQAAPGKKLIVSRAYSLVNTFAYAVNTTAAVQLTVGTLGGTNETASFDYSRSAQDDEGEKMSTVLVPKMTIETSCGGSETVIGEFTAQVSGEGRGNVYSHPLSFNVKEVPCQQ